MSIYRIKGTKNFLLDVTGLDGRRVRKSSGTDQIADARRMEAALLLELGSAPVFDSPSKSFSIGELVDQFLAYEQKMHPRSMRTYYCAATKDFLQWVGKDKPVTAITLKDLQAYQASRAESASRTTANRNFQVLKTLFRLAVEWGHLPANPASAIKRFREPGSRRRFLSVSEQETLLAACQEPFRAVVFVALRTGMRRGELLKLKARDVDFSRSLVSIWESKTDHPRHIPLLPEVRDQLAALAADLAPDAILFRSSSGKPYTAAGIESNFRRARRRAQLQVRFHDCRHTYASDCLASGMALAVISALLGHKLATTTARYAHLADSHIQEAVRGLGAYLAAKSYGKVRA